MKSLEAEEIMNLIVHCSQPIEIGNGPNGFLNVIPIKGGVFTGKISGEVIPGGADWNTVNTKQAIHVFAKYVLKAKNGEFISIENEGYIDNSYSDRRIVTTPRFKVSENGKYGWLNCGVYVGELNLVESDSTSVNIIIYKMS